MKTILSMNMYIYVFMFIDYDLVVKPYQTIIGEPSKSTRNSNFNLKEWILSI